MNVPNQLSKALNDSVVRRLAGPECYQRGLDYLSDGRVELLEEDDNGLRALVRGGREYTVTLTAGDGMFDYSCDCPIGNDAGFCKHCAAASLAWLKRTAGNAKAPTRSRKAKKLSLADAGKLLEHEEKDALVGMILDWAKDDSWLREQLILYAARHADPEIGVAAVRGALQKAIRVRGYLHYREVPAWARGVHFAIDSMEQLMRDGQAAAVIELCESALGFLSDAMEMVDDSDGHCSVLRNRLQQIHYAACVEVRPNPVDLAKRLFHWELHSAYEVFYGAAETYVEVLGAKGMKTFRELAEAEWAKVPSRGPGSKWSDVGANSRITHIMESLARASGDIEELVAVMSHDLSSAYHYWLIAEVYREAHQHDNALLWAEKGLKAFPERTDGRLRELAADEYHRRGRHDDAMQIIWAAFMELPFLESYKILERHAKKAEAWPEWRERALAEIRLRIAKAKEMAAGRAQPHWLRVHDNHSVLVEIFLHERRSEEAWQEACQGGCSGSLWLQLAANRENEHPEDSVPIYLKAAEAGIVAGRKSRYDEPVGLLIKAAAVMKRLDQSAAFGRHLDELRTKYKIKRNFISLLEQKRDSLYLK